MDRILVHPPISRNGRTQARIALVLGLIFFAVLALLLVVTLHRPGHQAAPAMHREWTNALWQTLPALAYLVLAAIVSPIARKARREARLIVSADGLEHRSGMPTYFPPLMPSTGNWRLRWDEIARVRYLRNVRALRLERKRGRPLLLVLKDWAEQTGGNVAAQPGEVPVTDHPLWRELQARGLLHLPDGNFDSSITFELDRHPATRWALVAGAGLTLYGFVDGAFDQEAYLYPENSYRFLLPALTIGLMVGVVAALWLRRAPGTAPVPRGIALGMGAMLWLAGTVAGYSAMLRVNQLCGGPLLQEPYRREANCMVLRPRNPELASIEFKPSTRGHWCAYAADQDIPVPVRKGLFGTYQAQLVGLADMPVPSRSR